MVRLKADPTIVRLKPDTTELAVPHIDADDLGVVEDVDAEPSAAA